MIKWLVFFVAWLGCSTEVLAVDIPIEITGSIQIPPCVINNGDVIEVDFKDVSLVDVENEDNRRKVTFHVQCNYVTPNAYVKVKGKGLGSNTNILATNVSGFGIALYQGDGLSTKLMLGDGVTHNGNDFIGYKIHEGLSGGEFTFTAVPYKDGNVELKPGSFFSSANISISYF